MANATPDPQVVKAIRKAGIERLVAQRQEHYFEKKELEAKVGKLSAQIMGLMMKHDCLNLQVGQYPVAVVTDATYTTFDKDGFINYLIEQGVDPKLVTKARTRFEEIKPKKPHLRVGQGTEAVSE